MHDLYCETAFHVSLNLKEIHGCVSIVCEYLCGECTCMYACV